MGKLVWEMEKERDVGGLIKALGDKDSSVRDHAASALGRIGDKRAVEPLIEALGLWAGLRVEAARALIELGLDKRKVELLEHLYFTFNGRWGKKIKEILTFVDRHPDCKLSDIDQQLTRPWKMKLEKLNSLLKKMKKRSLIETKGKFSFFGVNQEIQLTISHKGKDFLENEVVNSPIYTCSFQHSFTIHSHLIQFCGRHIAVFV